MAWDGRTRSHELPADWSRRRAEVLRRDGYRCTWLDEDEQRCTERADEVDHLDRNDHRIHRLRSLCTEHHAQVTATQALEARGIERTSPRPAERHPGLR